MKITKINIAVIFYIVSLIILLVLLPLGEDVHESLLLPYSAAVFVSFIIAAIVNIYTKSKFYAGIYLLTALFHLIAGLFIQILKYNILNLSPGGDFEGIGIDNDGWIYHSNAIILLSNPDYDTLFYSKMVALIYKIFGTNEYTACAVNAVISGFISVIICKMTASVYKNRAVSEFLGYITAFSFSVAAYTSVLMRDVYIILLSYMIIYFYYRFYQKNNFLYLLWSIICFLCLCPIRSYAAGAALSACLTANIILLARIKFKYSVLKINKYMIVMIAAGTISVLLCIKFQEFLNIDYIISLFDVETILQISEEGYGGANSSFGIDRIALSQNLPLFILVGYFCMFFAPFPQQWLLSKNIVQAFSASETIILYIFLLPSFFLGVLKGFKDRNFIISASFLYIIFVFAFYGMILDNSGAVFRGRAPFIPLIYMISLYAPAGLLKKFLKLLKI